ncbi:MAG: hypothetical protein WCD01_03660, partial [Candidatus Sulfotelmatobacter sp.]
ILCLLLALAAPVFAVDDGQVMYAGGTVPGLPAGAVGRLDTTSEESLTFEYSGTQVLIPYSQIESFEYSTEVTRHLGVMPAIAVGLIKKPPHQNGCINVSTCKQNNPHDDKKPNEAIDRPVSDSSCGNTAPRNSIHAPSNHRE